MRLLLPTLCVLSLAACTPEPVSTVHIVEASASAPWRSKVLKAAIKLVRTQGGGGSGVPVACEQLNEGMWAITILTCNHVIAGEHLAEFSALVGNDRWLGTPVLIAKHPTLDAVLLRVITLDGPIYIPQARVEQVELGERLFAIGYPNMGRRVMTEGIVGEPNGVSCDVFPGNSGGPVYDSTGKLVGIVQMCGGRMVKGMPYYISHDMVFVPIADLLPWLKKLLL